MQTKLPDGSVMVAGTVTKDAEIKHVGEKHAAVASFCIVAGKRKDTTTIFVNCKAWNGLAEYAASIKKGDSVCAIGQIKSREYGGKTYDDLECDWLNVAKHHIAPQVQTPKQADELPTGVIEAEFTEVEDDDGDLPF